MPSDKTAKDKQEVITFDKIYALTLPESNSPQRQVFKNTVEYLKELDAGLPDFTQKPASFFKRKLKADKSGILREAMAFEHLSYEELALFLEISNGTNYMGIAHGKDRQAIVGQLFSSNLASLELKLAIAQEWDGVLFSVGEWVFSEDGGKHITRLISSQARNLHLDVGDLFEQSFKRLFRNVIWTDPNADYHVAAKVIANLRPDVVTKETLLFMIAIVDDESYLVNGNLMLQAIANHARRLYGFDDDIPDKWILHSLM